MPLSKGKSDKAFSHNVEVEMDAGKPQKQALAIAYAMKKRAQKMAMGGSCEPHGESGCGVCYSKGDIVDKDNPAADSEDGRYMDSIDGDHDLVDRIMAKRYSKGGMVANDTDMTVDEAPAEFDDLVLDDDLESDYTGANSGDELGDVQEDEDRKDIVARIMRSRSKKDKLPRPA